MQIGTGASLSRICHQIHDLMYGSAVLGGYHRRLKMADSGASGVHGTRRPSGKEKTATWGNPFGRGLCWHSCKTSTMVAQLSSHPIADDTLFLSNLDAYIPVYAALVDFVIHFWVPGGKMPTRLSYLTYLLLSSLVVEL